MTPDLPEGFEPKDRAQPEPTKPADPRLGRLVEFDARSAAFPIRGLLRADQVRAPRSYTWNIGNAFMLNQGSEGACVGFSWAQELLARPVVASGIGHDQARAIYLRAQELDSWPGGAYPGASPIYEGTSVLAGAKAVQEAGHIGEYRWAFGLEDAVAAIAWAGPIVLGINWHEGMSDAEPDGRIRPTGPILGGHAIMANSVNVSKRRVGLVNSWGTSWGVDGRCWLAWDDLAALLEADGEACVPLKRKRVG